MPEIEAVISPELVSLVNSSGAPDTESSPMYVGRETSPGFTLIATPTPELISYDSISLKSAVNKAA